MIAKKPTTVASDRGGMRRETRARLPASWLIVGGTVFISICMTLLAVALIYQARERAIEAAHQNARQMAMTLEERLLRIIGATEVALRQTVNGINPLVRPDIDVRPFRGSVPELISISVRPGGLGLEARTVMQTANPGSPLSLVVSRPSIDRNGRWFISLLAEHEVGRTGSTLVAEAMLDIDMIRSAFASQPIGHTGSAVLFRSDAVLLFRVPNDRAQVGQSFTRAELFRHAAHRSAGTYQTHSVTDGVERIVAYRTLPILPVVVVVAVGLEEVLAPWRSDAIRFGSVVGLLVLLFLALAGYVATQSRRREHLEAERVRESEILRATLDSMDQGLLMVDRDDTIKVFNKRVAEILELPPGALTEGVRTHQIPALQDCHHDVDRVSDDTRWSMLHGRAFRTYEVNRPNGTTIEVRTVPVLSGGAVRTYTDITTRKRSEKRIAHLAHHDPLTDLPNRSKFHEVLQMILQTGDPIAVLYVDLDGFKTINDTLGHAAGDELLMALARRLKEAVQPDDIIARLGGDEFAVITYRTAVDSVMTLCRQLTATTADPFRVGPAEVSVGMTIGVAMSPDHGTDGETLLRAADLALYDGKDHSRGSVRLFDPVLEERANRRRQIELDLRSAITNQEFELHYQPIANADTRAIVGFEALVRWRHPVRGLVSPLEFIPIAEETGLIVDLGDWVLRQAARDAMTWPEVLRVQVNVSVLQIVRPTFAHRVVTILSESGLSPRRLEMEITESVLMANEKTVLETLHDLRALGIRIAMDDFGTGYSSLSYLCNFPFDTIKIDRSFVRGLDQTPERIEVIRAITTLARTMGIKTVAEGIETEAQLLALRQAGCVEVQGFFIGRPQPMRRKTDRPTAA